MKDDVLCKTCAIYTIVRTLKAFEGAYTQETVIDAFYEYCEQNKIEIVFDSRGERIGR